MPVACFLVTKTMAHPFVSDSVKINHTTDGNINEWKADKFEMDKETQILYSVDHDANNLYVALKVLDPKTQMRMVMQGMSMYLDKNGKKKERLGVEFPVRRDRDAAQIMNRNDRSKGAGQEGPPDPKEMRQKMAAAMIFLKTFGFDDQEEAKTQFIGEPNGVNIAFTWDDANNMYVEYQVPMSMLGTPAALNGKPLGIGWKLHAMEAPSFSGGGGATTTTTQLVSVPAGGSVGGRSSGAGGSSSRAGGRSNTAPANFDAGFKEQSLWTKYVLTF